MKNMRDLMSGVLFNALFSCVLYIALLLFSLDQSFTVDFALFINLVGIFVYLVTCYIYCYFSERITTNSIKIADDAYDSLWYRMTVRQQMKVMFIIQRAQKEFRLTGLELVDCSLATFLTVVIDFIILNLCSILMKLKIFLDFTSIKFLLFDYSSIERLIIELQLCFFVEKENNNIFIGI